MVWDFAGVVEAVNEMAKSPIGQLMLGGSAIRCVLFPALLQTHKLDSRRRATHLCCDFYFSSFFAVWWLLAVLDCCRALDLAELSVLL